MEDHGLLLEVRKILENEFGIPVSFSKKNRNELPYILIDLEEILIMHTVPKDLMHTKIKFSLEFNTDKSTFHAGLNYCAKTQKVLTSQPIKLEGGKKAWIIFSGKTNKSEEKDLNKTIIQYYEAGVRG